MSPSQHLQCLFLWRGNLLGYRLLDRPSKVTIGCKGGTTFTLPEAPGWGTRFVLLAPRRGAHTLRLAPGMTGRVALGGVTSDVTSFLVKTPATKSALVKSGVREAALSPGDEALIHFDPQGDLQIRIAWVDPPPLVARPRVRDVDPLLGKSLAWTGGILTVLLLVVLIVAGRSPARSLEISAERVAHIVPILREVADKEQARQQQAKAEEKQEDGKSKRMKGDVGKLGRADATQKDTVLPKGRQDILREKVSKKGLLGIIGSGRPAGSGLSKLFAANNPNEMEQALNGLAGAKVAVGRGSGGLSTAGAGSGGGGTGFGRIYGSSDIDTGGGRGGKGRGPTLGSRSEKEVKVEVSTGNPDSGGALSKEQVSRVVRAHTAGIKYCYEKELQRAPNLAGKIELTWIIQPDGSVQRAGVAVTTMRHAGVEGCMVRQLKQWQFPKSDGQTVVQSYPFLFKGGH